MELESMIRFADYKTEVLVCLRLAEQLYPSGQLPRTRAEWNEYPSIIKPCYRFNDDAGNG